MQPASEDDNFGEKKSANSRDCLGVIITEIYIFLHAMQLE